MFPKKHLSCRTTFGRERRENFAQVASLHGLLREQQLRDNDAQHDDNAAEHGGLVQKGLEQLAPPRVHGLDIVAEPVSHMMRQHPNTTFNNNSR